MKLRPVEGGSDAEGASAGVTLKLLSQRAGAETKDGKLKARAAERSSLHGGFVTGAGVPAPSGKLIDSQSREAPWVPVADVPSFV